MHAGNVVHFNHLCYFLVIRPFSLPKLCCNLGLFPLAAQSPKRSAGTSPIEDWSLKHGACLQQTYTWASFLTLYSKWEQLFTLMYDRGTDGFQSNAKASLMKINRKPRRANEAVEATGWRFPVCFSQYVCQLSTEFLSDKVHVLLFFKKRINNNNQISECDVFCLALGVFWSYTHF